MQNAVSKSGVLKRKSSMLRRKESKFFLLTNAGGLFQAKGIAAEYDSPKVYLTLTPISDVKLEKAGSDQKGESASVIRVYTKGAKGPPAELEAMSEVETLAWYNAMQDVIELLTMINGDPTCALPRPLQGLQPGMEGWYLEPTGRMALYTLSQQGVWHVTDRREYDEATVMYWMDNRQSRSVDYPVQGSGDSYLEDSVEHGEPDYPVNARSEPNGGLLDARRVDYPVPSDMQGGGAWVTPLSVAGTGPRPRDGREDGTAGNVAVVGVSVGGAGAGGMMATYRPPPPMPSTFAVGKGDWDADANSLVLHRPTAGERHSPEGREGRFRKEASGVSRRGSSAAAGDRLSPGMEVLQSSLLA